jgi:hypothetical protein
MAHRWRNPVRKLKTGASPAIQDDSDCDRPFGGSYGIGLQKEWCYFPQSQAQKRIADVPQPALVGLAAGNDDKFPVFGSDGCGLYMKQFELEDQPGYRSSLGVAGYPTTGDM